MTPEELDTLQEELEEYLPTSLQVKLGKLFDLVRNDEPIRKEWIENQRKLLEKQNNTSWDMFNDYPHKHPPTYKNINKLKSLLGFNHKKTTEKLEENQEKTGEEPDQNYGLSA